MVTHFNTQRVVRMELTPNGASYKATENEFLQLHDPDVHLTDVLEDTDGSLLVLNTGGWFRIGCPASLMAKPDALGAVYRVHQKGQAFSRVAKSGAPDWKLWKRAWEFKDDQEILRQLDDKNPHAVAEALTAVVERSTHDQQLLARLDKMMSEPLEPGLEHLLIRSLQQSPPPFHSGPVSDLAGSRSLLVGLPRRADDQDFGATVEHLLARLVPANSAELSSALRRCLEAMPKGPEIASSAFALWLKEARAEDGRLAFMSEVLTDTAQSQATQNIITALLSHPSWEVQATGIKIIASQTANATNEAWLTPLEKLLAERATHPLLDAVKKLKSARFDDKLQSIASETKRPLSIRLKALDAMKGLKLSGDSFVMVKGVLGDAGSNPAARIQAATMLASAPLDKEQQLAVAPLLGTVGPVELDKLLPLLRKAKDAEIARAMAVELTKSAVIANQQESVYRTAFSAQPPEIFENIVLPALRRASGADDGKKRQLTPLAEKVSLKGDATTGRTVYESGKGSCIACHQIASKGRNIGPNLSKIGAIRTERDLLESIIFPNNTLARDYEAHIIETSDGQSTLGVIKSHTAEGLLIVDVAGQEKNIPHNQIVSDTQLTTSLMPTGLDQTLQEQELCDLVAYLRSLK